MLSTSHTRRFGFALVVLSLAAIAWLTLRPAHASSPPTDSRLCVVCGPLAGDSLGYWAATLARQLERIAAFSLLGALAALIATGLILVPAAFALKGATPLDWIAAVSGVGIGAALTLLFNGNKEKKTRQRLGARGAIV